MNRDKTKRFWNTVAVIVLAVASFFGGRGMAPEAEVVEVVVEKIVEVEVDAPAVAEEAEPVLSDRDLQGGLPLRMVISSKDHPVHKLFIQGYLDACRDYDVYCDPILTGSGGGLDGALASFEQTIGLGSAGVTAAFGHPAIYEAAEEMAQHFPVVAAHTQVTRDLVPSLTAWVAADVESFPVIAGRDMGEAVNCQGPVAVTQNGPSDLENAVAENFKKGLWEQCPDIEILETQMEGVEPTAAAAVTSAIVAAHPDITGAFSTTGGGPTSWTTAVQDAGQEPGDVIIISMDYTRPNLDLVEAGWVYALCGQPIYEEYYRATELLIQVLRGEEVPFENLIPAPLIHKGETEPFYAINDAAGN